ncbi:MAG: enoyl-CoA hydratase/isomerase family protein [Solirubrobacteraceae bacterium]
MPPSTYAELIAEGRADERVLVRVERREERAIVTLDDPAKRNVLSAGLCLQLQSALQELTADPALRTIVLTGADPAFSAGGDLRMMQAGVASLDGEGGEGSTLMWRWIRRQFGGIVRQIAGADQTMVCALNGAAAGVGLAFALACDVILASDRATLVPAFGRIGLIPEVGTSWLLTRRLGHQRAFEFYVSGEHVDAETAHAWGLVNAVVPHADLPAATDAWCDRLAALPPYAPAMAKALLRQAGSMSWEQALATEEFAEPSCFTTAPFDAAVSGMLRRAPS